MRNLFLFLILTALFVQSCDTLRSTTQKGGVDTTIMSPAEYSTRDRNLDYILKFNKAAVLEMERGGIPASIILAQGVIESGAGQSELAVEANNHFGIKCSGNWNGKTYYKQDDDRDEQGNLKESCFRKYNNVEESYYDHGEFLRDPRKYNRYGFLFNLERTDYKSWANGLQTAGYATAQDYATKLINFIEKYKLYEYDRPGAVTDPVFPAKPSPGQGTPATPIGPAAPGQPGVVSGRIGRVNDVKVISSREGETLEDIARAYRIATTKVVDYNDRGYPPGVRLSPNTRIFIQSKKDRWHGRASDHSVREGQTMFDISQVYGIRLAKLLERNGLQRGQEPEVNERILLRGNAKPSRPIRLRDTSNEAPPGQPGVPPVKPTLPTGSKPTSEDDLDFVISPEDPLANKPGEPAKPKPSYPPPATTPGTSYPDDYEPTPTQPPGGWNPEPDTTPAPRGYHRVQKGDTLYKLSREYGLSVARLKQMNGMSDDNIKIGQLLKVQ